MYSKKVLDLYDNPCNVGKLNKDDKDVGTGMVGNPTCGDVAKLQIKVNDDGIVEDVKFLTYGCAAAIASMAYVTSLIKGKSLEDVEKIKDLDVSQELELPPVKLHCSVLAEDAIKLAIQDYKNKQ